MDVPTFHKNKRVCVCVYGLLLVTAPSGDAELVEYSQQPRSFLDSLSGTLARGNSWISFEFIKSLAV